MQHHECDGIVGKEAIFFCFAVFHDPELRSRDGGGVRMTVGVGIRVVEQHKTIGSRLKPVKTPGIDHLAGILAAIQGKKGVAVKGNPRCCQKLYEFHVVIIARWIDADFVEQYSCAGIPHPHKGQGAETCAESSDLTLHVFLL